MGRWIYGTAIVKFFSSDPRDVWQPSLARVVSTHPLCRLMKVWPTWPSLATSAPHCALTRPLATSQTCFWRPERNVHSNQGHGDGIHKVYEPGCQVFYRIQAWCCHRLHPCFQTEKRHGQITKQMAKTHPVGRKQQDVY